MRVTTSGGFDVFFSVFFGFLCKRFGLFGVLGFLFGFFEFISSQQLVKPVFAKFYQRKRC